MGEALGNLVAAIVYFQYPFEVDIQPSFISIGMMILLFGCITPFIVIEAPDIRMHKENQIHRQELLNLKKKGRCKQFCDNFVAYNLKVVTETKKNKKLLTLLLLIPLAYGPFVMNKLTMKRWIEHLYQEKEGVKKLTSDQLFVY